MQRKSNQIRSQANTGDTDQLIVDIVIQVCYMDYEALQPVSVSIEDLLI